jgi:high-affinity nickel permease
MVCFLSVLVLELDLITTGLDADHISAIDNATRQLVSLGQLPITCGEY